MTYATMAWMVDVLTDYTALECMPKETAELIRSGQSVELGDIFSHIRQQIWRSASKSEHFEKYGGKYEELHTSASSEY